MLAFGALRDYLPHPSNGRTVLEISQDATIADLLRTLGAPERLLHACLVDGRRASADEALDEDAEVTLMPPFSGGATDARRPYA